MALTNDRDTKCREGVAFSFPVAAGAVIFAGALVCLDGGYAVPGSEAADLTAVGRALTRADNAGGADGDVDAAVERGVFAYGNSSGADEITRADIGADCYVVDDATVAKTDNTGARSKAGVVMDVDAVGVWVRI
jgi:hypothetical protein